MIDCLSFNRNTFKYNYNWFVEAALYDSVCHCFKPHSSPFGRVTKS